jgi:hypothetical protein
MGDVLINLECYDVRTYLGFVKKTEMIQNYNQGQNIQISIPQKGILRN